MYERVDYNIICLKIDFIYASVQAFMHKITITSGWDGGIEEVEIWWSCPE